jgi:hypothetical protein
LPGQRELSLHSTKCLTCASDNVTRENWMHVGQKEPTQARMALLSRPRTLHSNATQPDYGRVVLQPTCYAGFGMPANTTLFSETPFRNSSAAHSTTSTHSKYLRKTLYKLPIRPSLGTANRLVPPPSNLTPDAYSLYKDCPRFRSRTVSNQAVVCQKIGLYPVEGVSCGEPSTGWRKGPAKQRGISTAQFSRTLYQADRGQTAIRIPHNGRKPQRPGTSSKKQPERRAPEVGEEKTGGDTQNYNTRASATVEPEPVAPMRRLWTPQIPSRRPDSRYNRATLFVGLDYGRDRSPDYHVPILEMNFSESINQHLIVPSCWN